MIRIQLKPAAERAVRSGHPWIYDESIVSQSSAGVSGDYAAIYSRRDRFMAIGLYDPDSPLRVRLLHAGKPQPLDEAWWRAHFQNAVAKRRELFDANTTGYRLIHGENDGWPGLVLDRYDTAAVLKLYTSAWFPHLPRLLELINRELTPQRLVLRLSRNIQEPARVGFDFKDGQELQPSSPGDPTVIFKESGLSFEADIIQGQKTGFFLDQRENRRRVESLAHGRRVLNAFSFSGGFSVYAARGGAASVTDLDISSHALQSADRNFALNAAIPAVRRCSREKIQADAFDWLKGNSIRQFDLVILDPPALAKKRSDVPQALRAYGRLIEAGLKLVQPGGILVAASCSAQVSADEFFALASDSVYKIASNFRVLDRTTHPPDHPARFREAEYLKCIYIQLL